MPNQPENVGQTQNTADCLSKLGSNSLDWIMKKFSEPSKERRNRFILLFTTSILLSFIILPKHYFSSLEFHAGDIATSDIRAPQDYLIEDQALTELRRKEAGSNAHTIYNLTDRAASNIVGKFELALSSINKEKLAKREKDTKEWQKFLSPIFDTDLTEAETAAILRIKSNDIFSEDLGKRLNELYQIKIVLDSKVFKNDSRRNIEIVDNNGHSIGKLDESTNHLEIEDARNVVTGWHLAGLDKQDDHKIVSALIARILLPNFFYNREATEARVKSDTEAIRPVLYKVQKGEMIVRVGERITIEQAHKLITIFKEKHAGNKVFGAIGVFALIIVLLYFPYRFACKNIRKFNPTNKDILILSLLIIGSFFIFRIAMQITNNIGSVFPNIDTNNYFYLFPFAVTPMVVRIFLNSEAALVYCATLAPLLGMMFGGSIPVVIYALLGGIVGAHGVRQCSDRSTIYTAGLKVSFVSLAMAFSLQIANNNFFTVQTIYVFVFAFASGILSAGIISGIVPLIESLFHYTTDIKLLELANLNSPILRDLMVNAPGTYHHSVIVGSLVEAAAESINANPLLARVSAYYHDIGKSVKPLYFIENQKGEENRHDKLTPSMSALILISHIKEGAEIAREKRLGQPIIDIIKQHHGTALIKFFYNRAKEQAEALGQTVEEKDFRYPGPKPQTREAGIVMLADNVEAASRTLINPSPDRIQGMVQKIINNIFIDGQLEECELTLKNLHEIAKSFNTVLNAIHHHRIEYPEPVHKGGNGSKKSDHKNSGNEQNKTGNGDTGSDDIPKQPPEAPLDRYFENKEGSRDDIKRLGMS